MLLLIICMASCSIATALVAITYGDNRRRRASYAAAVRAHYARSSQ